MTAPAVVRALRDVFEQREHKRAAIRASLVVGRNEDGTTRLQRLDGECVARGCVTPEGAGEVTRRPAGPCWQNQGTTGVALLTFRGSGRVLWVESIEPAFYAPGESYTVTVTGRGLTATTVFDFLGPGSEEVSPWITQTAVRWVSAEEMEIDLEVDAAAPAMVEAALAYDDPGAPS